MSILVADVANELAVLPQICPYDDRFWRYLNVSQRQLFLEGNYTGIYASYNFLVYNDLITLPYECEALLQADILGCPVYVNNQWFEFLQAGPGYQTGAQQNGQIAPPYNAPDFYDRGSSSCVIQDAPAPFQVQIYCAVPEDPNATCIIEGLDINGNAVRSQITTQNGDGTVSGQWINGVQSPIYAASVAFQEPAQIFSKITALNFPTRNGDLRLLANALNPTTLQPTGITYLLGVYPYFQTNPTFRQYALPVARGLVGGTGTPPAPVPVYALVRRRPLPLNSPKDRLPIDNVEALRCFFMAAYNDEEENYDKADRLRARGKYYLEQEMRKTKRGMDRINFDFRGGALFPRLPGSL